MPYFCFLHLPDNRSQFLSLCSAHLHLRGSWAWVRVQAHLAPNVICLSVEGMCTEYFWVRINFFIVAIILRAFIFAFCASTVLNSF